MKKPILKNCQHCGGEISFRVFADKRRKHSRYVLSVKCEKCKTVTTICTKERGGAAFAALAEKWNARTETNPPYGADHVNCRCTLEPQRRERPQYRISGIELRGCTKCGHCPAGFDIRDVYAYANGHLYEKAWMCRVVCDCGAVSREYILDNNSALTQEDIYLMKKNAAAFWNTEGAI